MNRMRKSFIDHYTTKDVLGLIEYCRETFGASSQEKANSLYSMNLEEFNVTINKERYFQKIEHAITANQDIISFIIGKQRTLVTRDDVFIYIKNKKKYFGDLVCVFILINLLRRYLTEEKESLFKIVRGQTEFYQKALNLSQ